MGDRQKWNERHAAAGPGRPSSFLVEHAHLLPPGRALDVACGTGRNAVFLATRGLDVTAVDVSDVALVRTQEAAAAAGAGVRTLRLDLPADPLPDGPWNAIACAWFLERALFPAFEALLAPGGVLFLELPTRLHAERTGFNARWCVEPGELERTFARLETLARREREPEGREVESLLLRRPLA